jgi:acyl-CoA synthetase (AMP-forming)/AMP-acid ligase II/acyl carrier protein
MSIQMSPASFVQRPVRWLRAISYFRATHSGGPNFAYDLCVRGIPEEMRPSLDLSSWRVAFNGAEPVRKKTLDRFGECFEPCGFSPVAFRPCYGLAEATLKVTFRKLDEENTFFPASAADLEHGKVVRADSIEETGRILVGCGSTAHDTRISIVDPETLLPCESDELGEIWVSGSSVTGGYWNRPDATQAAFGAYTSGGGEGPYLRTGDLGFQADGQLFVTGRIKDLIVIRGLNHYPQDIELTVEGCDPTLRPNLGAAFSVEHQNEERLVIVHEVHRSSNKADLEPILSRIRTLVTEEHEVEPLAVVLVRHGSIAKTSSGKIQRFACRRSFLENELLVVAEWRAPSPREGGEPPPGRTATGRGDDASPPSGDDIRRWLVANISAETKLDPAAIDLNRPFAHFGLDSMRGLELVGKLEVWLGRRLPVTMLWNFPTIEALADRLSQQSEAD